MNLLKSFHQCREQYIGLLKKLAQINSFRIYDINPASLTNQNEIELAYFLTEIKCHSVVDGNFLLRLGRTLESVGLAHHPTTVDDRKRQLVMLQDILNNIRQFELISEDKAKL